MISDAVKLLAVERGLEPGVTLSGLTCPTCNGGTTKERSFSVGMDDNDNTIWWKCHRASCEERGGTGYLSRGWASSLSEVSPLTQNKTVRSEFLTVPLEVDDYEFFLDRWDLDCDFLDEAGFMKVYDRKLTYQQPVRDPRGYERGYIIRQYEPKRILMTHKHGEPWLAWYYDFTSNKVVVVEDQLSAIKLYSSHYTAVALMGTDLSPDKLLEIANEAKGHPILLCLDGDALEKAVHLSNRYKALCNIQVVPVSKEDPDPKEWEEQEIRARIGDNNDGTRSYSILPRES